MNGHHEIVPSFVFIAAKAYAKLNLCLAVSAPEPAGSPRAGWHRIASWFHAIDLCDELYLERSTDGQSVFDIRYAEDATGLVDWPIEKDLCFKAVKLLEEHCGEPLPVRLRLRKRIPSGGGLGGGSSNAAAVMRGMNSLFGIDIENETLAYLSRKLGSDVAFFMDGDLERPPRPAIVRAFGDNIERTAALSAELSLLVPPFGCPTPQVYAAFDQLNSGNAVAFMEDQVIHLVKAAIKRGTIDSSSLFNDLTSAAEKVQPRLSPILHAARAIPVPVHMSGSGSTLFVLGSSAPVISDVRLIRTRLV